MMSASVHRARLAVPVRRRTPNGPVSPDYGPRGNAFTGTIKWVQIDIDAAAEDIDHTIGAEERFQLAMARQ
jgi:hypothetical protein